MGHKTARSAEHKGDLPHTWHPRLWCVWPNYTCPGLGIVLDNLRAALRAVRFRDQAKIAEFVNTRPS